MRVDTIPADFYGGANPVIKFKKVEKEVDLTPKKAGAYLGRKSAFG